MYLVRVTPLMNFTFSDDSLFLKKNLGGGHKFSEFACYNMVFDKTQINAGGPKKLSYMIDIYTLLLI